MKLADQYGRARGRAAFTLLEMIFVLAIIAVLVGSGIFALRNVIGDAKEGRVTADLKTLEMNLLRYQTKVGRLPTQSQGLVALVNRPSEPPQPKTWKSFMGPEALNDPYGFPYAYHYPARKSAKDFDLFSVGRDGVEGTEDDVGNW